MRLNRSHKRPLEVTIGRADRDPMFKPVWYDGAVTLTPPTEPVEVASPQGDLAPLPPASEPPAPSARELQWKQVVERAHEVVERIRSDPHVDGAVLVEVVNSLVDINPSAEEIVEAYRKRMEAKRQ